MKEKEIIGEAFTLVTAIKKELYKLEIGHDGYTSGCGYDGEDEWHKTFYGETVEEIAEKLIAGNFKLIANYFISADSNAGANILRYSKEETLCYEDRIFDLKQISKFSNYIDNNKEDIREFNNLFETFRNKSLEIQKAVTQYYAV